MERENTSPTAVGNSVAIPHPMQLLSEKLFDVLHLKRLLIGEIKSTSNYFI